MVSRIVYKNFSFLEVHYFTDSIVLWLFITGMIVVVLILVFLVLRVYRSRKTREEEERSLVALRFFDSIEHERKALASELHDSIGQDLLIIKNRAHLGLQSKRKKEMIEQFEQITEVVTHAIEKTRELSYALRPYQIDRLGLTKALESLITRSFHDVPIKVTKTISLDDTKIPANYSIHIYRIIQEGIHNIRKHSKATEAAILVELRENVMVIDIADNGTGFHIGNNGAMRKGNGGLGIPLLQERVYILRGKFTITSEIGHGTNIHIELPLMTKPWNEE